MNDLVDRINEAENRIGPHVLKTPLFLSPYLSTLNNGKVFLKLESEQYTGSFKARGALNKVLIGKAQGARKFVAASTGNHAQGFARALQIAGVEGMIYLPENAESSKVEAIRNYDAELIFHGTTPLEAELEGVKVSRQTGAVWVSPYNDLDVIAGQGTIALEITESLSSVDAVFGCIGGGGMMSGVGRWMRHASPQTKLVGCLPENAPEMYLSVKAGKVTALEQYKETLSDGSAGGMEEGAITFPLCQELIDDYILVSERSIRDGIWWMAEKHHKIIEGAASVALRAFMENAGKFEGQTVVIIICGANITTEKLVSILGN